MRAGGRECARGDSELCLPLFLQTCLQDPVVSTSSSASAAILIIPIISHSFVCAGDRQAHAIRGREGVGDRCADGWR